MKDLHQPVLLREVVQHLMGPADGLYVDGTVGTAGHSLRIATRLGKGGRLLCLDRDPDAVKISRERLAPLGDRVIVTQGNFADLDVILGVRGLGCVDGIFLDLGMSSYQLERSGRGFSFQRNEGLDMRMDPGDAISARELVNQLGLEEIEKILRAYGEEKYARRIAKAIVQGRKKGPIRTSSELANLVRSAVSSSRFRDRDPATKTFQAFRIAVNRELDHLSVFLKKAPGLVCKGGRVVILSYHSLEDRLVKLAIKGWERGCTCPPDLPECVCGKSPSFRRCFTKGIKPREEEVRINPRARSAVLRAAERI